jgi:hypothetical protein
VAIRVDEQSRVATQKVIARRRAILAPAASASSMIASTSCGERTLWASVTPPQPVAMVAESQVTCQGAWPAVPTELPIHEAVGAILEGVALLLAGDELVVDGLI